MGRKKIVVVLTCDGCGRLYEPKRKNPKHLANVETNFCSRKCQGLHFKGKIVELPCSKCGKLFKRTNGRGKLLCCQSCRKCLQCGVAVKLSCTRFCSKKCYGLYYSAHLVVRGVRETNPRKAAIDNGDHVYFTGKPCKHGHLSGRLTRTGKCFECTKQTCAKSRQKASKERPHLFRAMEKRYWDKHPEKKRLRSRSASNRRRATQARAVGNHTTKELSAKWEQQGKKCAVPGCTHNISGRSRHLDHIWPLSDQVTGFTGTNFITNIEFLCAFHNSTKNCRDPYEWARSLNLSEEDYNTLTKDYEAAKPKEAPKQTIKRSPEQMGLF